MENNNKIKIALTCPLDPGQSVLLCQDTGEANSGQASTQSRMLGLKAGHILSLDENQAFRLKQKVWTAAKDGSLLVPAWEMDVLSSIPKKEQEFQIVEKGPALAWITMSDKGSQGKRHDESGPLIEKMVAEKLDLRLTRGFCIPDEADVLRALLTRLSLEQGFELIMTTGGTGVGPRDITPEATIKVLDKRLQGYEIAMTTTGLAKTPHAAISRAVAGTIGTSLVVNMPGSPKAVRESLEAILPAIGHTLDKLSGDSADCAIRS